MACLVRLYVDIEHTGDSMGFYLKYKYRFFVANLLKLVWDTKIYRDSFLEASKD